MTTILAEKQAKELATLNVKNNLENVFTDLIGITPSIVCPESNPFAVFYPKNNNDYLAILNSLPPINENFVLGFAGKNSIDTFSPYSIHYGGKHDTPNYMEVVVKFKHSVCPVWIKIPKDSIDGKFNVSTYDGKHIGFGRHERLYIYTPIDGTKVQSYYGENKTMYASNESESAKIKEFIFR